jgi:hypothetical protein
METPPEIGFVCLGVIGTALGQTDSLITRKMRNDCLGDILGDRVFQTQDVRKCLIKLSGPNRRAIANA